MLDFHGLHAVLPVLHWQFPLVTISVVGLIENLRRTTKMAAGRRAKEPEVQNRFEVGVP